MSNFMLSVSIFDKLLFLFLTVDFQSRRLPTTAVWPISRSKTFHWILYVSQSWESKSWGILFISQLSSFLCTTFCWGRTSGYPIGREIQLMDAWRRAFSTVAPQLWYSLPREAHLAPSLSTFHKLAKGEHFRWAFLWFRVLIHCRLGSRWDYCYFSCF